MTTDGNNQPLVIEPIGEDAGPPAAAGSPPRRIDASTRHLSSDINWRNSFFSIRQIKELIVIGFAIYVLWCLLKMLGTFVEALGNMLNKVGVFSRSPFVVAQAIDWHVLLIGTALIVAIATILIVLMKNVLASESSAEQGRSDLEVKDMPIGEFISAIWGMIKPK